MHSKLVKRGIVLGSLFGALNKSCQHITFFAILSQLEYFMSGCYPHSFLCAVMWSVLTKLKLQSPEEAAARTNMRPTFVSYMHKVSHGLRGLKTVVDRHGVQVGLTTPNKLSNLFFVRIRSTLVLEKRKLHVGFNIRYPLWCVPA